MTDYDVAVVGAGAAGIAATRLLADENLNVICLEASGRVGGRAHTDTEIFGVPFDTGAHWMHCEHINALKSPGLAMGLNLYEVDEDRAVTAGLENDDILWDQVDAVFEDAKHALNSIGENDDLSMDDVLKVDGPWGLTAKMMCCLSMARDPNQISLRDLFNWEGGKDLFCKEGFGHLVARLANQLPIKLSVPVKEIQVLPKEVRLTTDNGSLTAKAVIVTASVGVLAEDVIRFDPPLDAERRSALDAITMSDYGHTALLFQPGTIPLESDIWLTYQINEVADAVPQGGGFLCNVGGTGLTNFETSGSFNRTLQDAGPETAVDHALEILVGIFGSEVRSKFIKGHSTKWRHEPYVRGSYSGALPGGSAKREVLARPHADRIYFAGEATHRGQQASVSGAYLEGQRIANEILKSRKRNIR